MALLPVRRRYFTMARDCSAAARSRRPMRRRRESWMPRPLSAGILLFRQCSGETEVLLVRPGGPYWRTKDVGAWMIPKGHVEPGEAPSEAALREFTEETGAKLGNLPFPLAVIRQAGGKLVEAFAIEGDFDPASLRPNEFELEWPPRRGKLKPFPQISQRPCISLTPPPPPILPTPFP